MRGRNAIKKGPALARECYNSCVKAFGSWRLLCEAVGQAVRRPARPRAAPFEVRRILVFGYGALGDLILFLPVLEGLRRGFPGARIAFLANRYMTTDELLPATGLIDDIWLHDWEGPRALEERAGINKRIAREGFDLAVLTLSSPAHYFYPGLKAIPLRAGHLCRIEPGPLWARHKRMLVTGEFARRALLNLAAWVGLQPEHAAARNLRLLEALGRPWPRDCRPRLPIGETQRLRVAQLLEGRSPIGVHLGPPFSYNSRYWAPERFGELCAKLAADGAGPFVLIGGPQDEPSAARALKVFPRFVSLIGRLSLLETFAAIERCRLFICSDTGPGKVAMALGVPTVMLWGPSDPLEAGAVWEPEKHLDVRTGIWCSPCSRMGMTKFGALNHDTCGHHDCLEKLDFDRVFSAIRAKYPALFSAQR